jgi:uncharacterized protein with ParB-like and HNH nuclease domain
LDYRNRKIRIKKHNIMEFIQHLATGEFLIPTFQRVFVWNPEDIISLWESIYQHYPIGSILCWKTRTLLHVHRKIGGFFIADSNIAGPPKIQSYILDGQQRATALLASFFGGTGKVKEHYSFDYTLYFDLTRAVFFFEKDYYRHRWEADAAFLIRLKEAQALPADYCRSLQSKDGFSPVVEKNLEQLEYLFTDYDVQIINLEEFDIAAVCSIFERINQTGMRLQNMDILIARSFKNYATVVDEDFPTA